MNKKDSYDLACEVRDAADIVSGISYMFDEGSSRLTDEYMKSALFGVASYLDRIADELAEM